MLFLSVDRTKNLEVREDGMYYYYKTGSSLSNLAQAEDFCNEPGFHFPVFMTTPQRQVVRDLYLNKIGKSLYQK